MNPENQAGRIHDALFRGEKIEAIKLYREQTGVGLAEAKQAVEQVERELRASLPGRFTAPAGKGCSVSAGVFAVLVAIGGLLLWVLASK
ncbi:MAG: ribosomal protein L7/L12 [Chthoniobacteraceae bacterium]